MSDSDSDDIQTIDKVLKGDIDAFSRIVEKYKDRVFNYVYTQIGDFDEALDVSQEIFIMTLEALDSFRRESKFSTWLYSIMVNYCKNYRKKISRYSLVPINSARGEDEYELPLPDEREDPERDAVMNDSLRIVREEINRLPDDYREILMLRDIQGLSYNEISEILDISLSNVKVRAP